MFRLVRTAYLRALEARVVRETAAAFAAREMARTERELRESGDALVRAVLGAALGERPPDPLSPATRARVDRIKASYRADHDPAP